MVEPSSNPHSAVEACQVPVIPRQPNLPLSDDLKTQIHFGENTGMQTKQEVNEELKTCALNSRTIEAEP